MESIWKFKQKYTKFENIFKKDRWLGYIKVCTVCNMYTCIDNIEDSQQKGKCLINTCTVASDFMMDLKKNSWNGGMSPMPT